MRGTVAKRLRKIARIGTSAKAQFESNYKRAKKAYLRNQRAVIQTN